jgi:membrane protein HdeD
MKNSTKLMLLGALAILFGVIVLGNAAMASVAVVALTAGVLLVGGGFQIIGGFSVDSTGGKLLAWLTGALMLLLGWSFLANPLQGVISLAMLILILLAIGGVARLVYAWRLRSTGLFWPMLLSGALSILLAAYILSSPEATMLLLGTLLGVEMLLSGVGLVLFGQFLRRNGS